MVDDDESVLRMFGKFFIAHGYQFIPVSDPRTFLKHITTRKPDIIIMDIVVGEIRGENLIKAMRKCGVSTPVFVVSGHLNKKILLDLRNSNVSGFYSKPVSLEKLELKIREELAQPQGSKELDPACMGPTGKRWPPLTVLVMTDNSSIAEHPDTVIPASIIERFRLRIFTKSGFHESIPVIKNPDSNIKLVVIDATRESTIKGMLRLLKIISANNKIPMFFTADTFSTPFKNSLIQSGFANIFLKSSVQTKDVAQKYESALTGRDDGAALESAMRVQNIMQQISAIKTLPPMPDIYLRIEKLSGDPNATSKDYADILELDPGITARLLRMSNSAFYSFKRKIKTVKDTVTLMGTREILSLVRLACITGNLKSNPDVEVAVRKIWEHSAACAITAKVLYENTNICMQEDLAEELFICGIIHDIGKIVMWNHFPDIYMSFMLNPGVSENPDITEEEHFMGASHADVGRSLAEHWNLPERLHDAIAFHHKPMMRADADPVTMIHFANIMSQMVMNTIPVDHEPPFSKELLEKTGATVDTFRDLAQEHGPTIKDNVATITKMVTG